jgi:hypothetical protein
VQVLLVVIDAATPRVVCPAVQTGRLPVMQALMERGGMHQGSVTIFPSITPAATTSIITGAYPSEHGIVGASWYDEARQEIAYYGDDFWVIAREGFGAFLRDFLVRLNGDRLKSPTLFELVEQTGRNAACLNYLVFRGPHEHKVNVPWLMTLLPGVPFTETVKGPSVLCLGDFVSTRTIKGRKLQDEAGLLHRFGMDDASTGTLLCQMAEDGSFPDLTVAYFADTDYRSHEVGPFVGLPTVEHVDRALGEMFEAAGGMDRFLERTAVLITSDHGHCEVLPESGHSVIHLDLALDGVQLATLGKGWRHGDRAMICPNMRAAQIHLREVTPGLVTRVAGFALRDPRIDQVIWRAELAGGPANRYVVATARGRLEFWRGEDGRSGSGRDDFATAWSWQGEPAALALKQDGGRLVWTDYPNAFERIAGALDSRHNGDMWVTARPGCEFTVPGGTAHPGGASHGALHALDSLSPVILAGAPRGVTLPDVMRSIDIAPLCMTLLGVPMRYGVGDPRGTPR